MSFYKIQDDELICAPSFVYAPNYTLKCEEKDTYTYPVDGWYWYDTLAQAMSSLTTSTSVVTRRQFKLALLTIGLLETVENMIALSTDKVLKINYAEALEFDRSNPFIISMAELLDKTPKEIDELFALAKTL